MVRTKKLKTRAGGNHPIKKMPPSLKHQPKEKAWLRGAAALFKTDEIDDGETSALGVLLSAVARAAVCLPGQQRREAAHLVASAAVEMLRIGNYSSTSIEEADDTMSYLFDHVGPEGGELQDFVDGGFDDLLEEPAPEVEEVSPSRA
jgi:hypothetical protein